MKNRPSTTSKFYVQNWAQREAVRLSMKCYNKFNLDDMNLKSHIPSQDQVKSWVKRQVSKINADFDENLEDQELFDAIDNYDTDGT